MMKIISTATLMAFAASTSFAGSFGEAEVEQDVDTFVPVATSSLSTPLIIGAVLGTALVVGAISSSNDNDDGSVDGHGAD